MGPPVGENFPTKLPFSVFQILKISEPAHLKIQIFNICLSIYPPIFFLSTTVTTTKTRRKKEEGRTTSPNNHFSRHPKVKNTTPHLSNLDSATFIDDFFLFLLSLLPIRAVGNVMFLANVNQTLLFQLLVTSIFRWNHAWSKRPNPGRGHQRHDSGFWAPPGLRRRRFCTAKEWPWTGSASISSIWQQREYPSGEFDVEGAPEDPPEEEPVAVLVPTYAPPRHHCYCQCISTLLSFPFTSSQFHLCWVLWLEDLMGILTIFTENESWVSWVDGSNWLEDHGCENYQAPLDHPNPFTYDYALDLQ